MTFQVRTTEQTAPGRDGTVEVLEGHHPACRVLIWPGLGFNAYSWLHARDGHTLDLLYSEPSLFLEGRANTSGNPILFPFPNRIRGGRFTWDGRTYDVPRNETAAGNAIHGFVLDRPWRVIDRGADASSAWITAEFQGSRDAPETLACWPADYLLRVTYRLTADALTIDNLVTNPDRRPLPFGLGHHPYFRLPFVRDTAAADCQVAAQGRRVWTLVDFLPTGDTLPVSGPLDLRSPRSMEGLVLNDVYGDLAGDPGPDGLRLCGLVRQPAQGVELRVRASPDFRELVLYTPGHRQSVCLEPYTCVTDAINLQSRGLDAGLRVLAPGQSWSGTVQFALAS